MTNQTVSVCMMVRDDLPFLKESLPRALRYADEVIVADTGSTDGSLEYARKQLRSTDILIQAKPNQIPRFGFAWMRECIAEQATKDWIHFIDADEHLLESQIDLYREILNKTTRDVIQIRTETPAFSDKLAGKSWHEIWIGSQNFQKETHRRIYRRGKGVTWRGYIHEELYVGTVNAAHLAQPTDLVHCHYKWFRNYGDPRIKWWRYAWMLKRAKHNPELQAGTNGYWYNHYYPTHEAEILKGAALYEEHRPDFTSDGVAVPSPATSDNNAVGPA